MTYPNIKSQLTSQGVELTKVYFKDKNSDMIWSKEVIKAMLAKLYRENLVVGAIKGIPVAEV